jgi:uncharacterized membrane protein YgdD (TMEM256/DUF423 family)
MRNFKERKEPCMRGWLACAGVNGFIAVMMGAGAAHMVQGRMTQHGSELIETAARYQMFHALALFGVAWLATAKSGIAARAAGFAFVIGCVLFSGCLYGLALTDNNAFALPIPIGGVAFMLGWTAVTASAIKH